MSVVHTLVHGPPLGPWSILWTLVHALVCGPCPGLWSIPWYVVHLLVRGPSLGPWSINSIKNTMYYLYAPSHPHSGMNPIKC